MTDEPAAEPPAPCRCRLVDELGDAMFVSSMRKWSTVALILVAAGCAKERGAINRVQPDALAKSFFVGKDLVSTADDPEFYKRGTIVDVSYGAGASGLFTSSYAQPTSRIRWQITENTLNARLSYERITGTDGKGNAYDGTQLKPAGDGQIVASYTILSHFDVKRDYNPQTGEQLNIVVENSTDRPWYAREYFRVDWSKNLVTAAYDYDSLAMLGVYGAVTYEPFSYTVLDPADPNVPHFEADQGYFDVTNKAYATPQMVDLSSLGFGPGQFPACMLPSATFQGGTEPWGNCNPIEITIRESYRLVVDTDYEAFDFDGVRFQAIGAFNFDYRHTYDRNYGLVDKEWSRFLARYNIWKRSHVYSDPVKMTGPIACDTQQTTETPTGTPSADPNRDVDGNGTADECESAGAGSQCDVFRHACTLPYASREAAVIPWYLTGDQSLFTPTDWAVQEWDLAMKTAVQTARLVECRRTGGADCDSRFPVWKGQQDDNDEGVRISREVNACRRKMGWTAAACDSLAAMRADDLATERKTPGDPSTLAIGKIVTMQPVFALCHNPVIAGDHPACGKVGLAVRQGDLRYHTVLDIPNPQTPSAWGIMVDANDPLTGEKVAGSMNIWTAVTDMAAQQLVDLVRYASGDLPTSAITNGTYIQDYLAGNKLLKGGGLPTLSRDDVTQRLAGLSHLDLKAFTALANTPITPDVQAIIATGKARVLDVQARNDVASPGQAKIQATLNLARGSNVETQLLNPAMLQLAGVPAGASAQGALADRVSPLALNSPLARSRIHQLRENALASRGACVIDEAPEPTSMSGLADILNAKFPRGTDESPAQTQDRAGRMFTYVRDRYHYSVIAHEMGHSVGLRHNFVSSSAPLFYRPQYWQLRTKNGTVTTPCTDAVDDGATCVGPRYWDPVTTEEQSQMIWMFMQSTVMDYPGETSQDFMGLGATDFAAARFFYGDSVSVYTDPSYRAGSKIGVGISAATDTFGGILGIRYGVTAAGGTGTDDFHYSQLQNNYNVINRCQPVTVGPPADWDESKDGVWNAVLDGKVVAVDGVTTKCRQQPVDYVAYGDLHPATAAQTNNGSSATSNPSVDSSSRLRVPYSFASDNWADTGNVSVFRHDNGADPYEQAQFFVTVHEDRSIFDNYRRGRTTFSLIGAADRSFNRYNAKLQGMAGGVGFLASIYRDVGTGQGYSFDSLWPLIVRQTAQDNMLAATVAFDHFVRQLSRPEPGLHYLRDPAFADPVFHSATDADDFGPPTTTRPVFGQRPAARPVIPNGSTGYLRDLGFGGRPLENALSTNAGDFDVEYIQNAGSYYDKINTAILFAESEDRFISQSRRDFYDARFRAIGMADILPDGFRRVISNALTGDRSILAPRLQADAQGQPMLDSTASIATDPLAAQYPARPIGWPSMWPSAGPQICFSAQGRNVCSAYTGDLQFGAAVPAQTALIDPQIGWEVQKFLMTWTVALIKANEKTDWIDSMRIYRLGQNSSPDIDPRVEWQDPASGQLYYARDLGSECLFGDLANSCAGGKIVQKGIAARVLQYANELTGKGYKLDVTGFPATATTVAGFNAQGRAMVLKHPGGAAIVKADPAVNNYDGTQKGSAIPDCDQNLTPTCTPLSETDNHSAYELKSYKSVPDYLWQAELEYGWFSDPSARGVY
jgi:hypothetical protein